MYILVRPSHGRTWEYFCVAEVQSPKMNMEASSVYTRGGGGSKEPGSKLGRPRASEPVTPGSSCPECSGRQPGLGAPSTWWRLSCPQPFRSQAPRNLS